MMMASVVIHPDVIWEGADTLTGTPPPCGNGEGLWLILGEPGFQMR